jgi:hypothetical protein
MEIEVVDDVRPSPRQASGERGLDPVCLANPLTVAGTALLGHELP